jgi:DNA-binding transcriptional MerR regulator
LATHEGLVCDVCGFWYHSECEEVIEDIYEFLYDHVDNSSIAWYRKKCYVTSRKFMMSTMNEQHQQVEEKLSQLDKNIKIRMDAMMSDMKNQIDDLRITLSKSQDKSKTWSSVVSVEEKVEKIIAAVEKWENISQVQSM